MSVANDQRMRVDVRNFMSSELRCLSLIVYVLLRFGRLRCHTNVLVICI